MDPFEKYKKEYWKKKTGKHRKGEILEVVNELTGLHKKSVIRKFKRLQFLDQAAKKSMPTKLGRPCIYDFKTIVALKKLWELGGKICAELLHPMIKEYIRQYEKNNDWKYGKEITQKLSQMSLSTVKKKLENFLKKIGTIFAKESQPPSQPLSSRLSPFETLLGLRLKLAKDNWIPWFIVEIVCREKWPIRSILPTS